MSLDLHPLAPSDWASPYEHLDPEGDVLPVPADEQPVPGWGDPDEYREDQR